MAKHLFQNGNPGGGRKAIPKEISEKLEKALPEAIDMLIHLMKKSKSDKIRVMCANLIIERHLGKPVQPIGNENEEKPFLLKVI